MWRIGEGAWHPFAGSSTDEDATVIAECAGICTLEKGERERVNRLVRGILVMQPEMAGVTNLTEHHIRLTDSEPVRHKTRRMWPRMWEIAAEEVRKLADEGIIERSASDYNSTPVLVKNRMAHIACALIISTT